MRSSIMVVIWRSAVSIIQKLGKRQSVKLFDKGSFHVIEPEAINLKVPMLTDSNKLGNPFWPDPV